MKILKDKLILFIAVIFMLTTSLMGSGNGVTIVYASRDLSVVVDGKEVIFSDAKPFINSNNRTMVPVTKISEMLGATVEWDSKTRTVSITKGSKIVTLTIGQSLIHINGKKDQMDTAATIIGKRTYVPLSFIARAFGASVAFHPHNQQSALLVDTVLIKSNPAQNQGVDLSQKLKLSKKDYYNNLSNINNMTLINTDGDSLFYSNTYDEFKLYKLDLKTGYSTKLYDKSDVFDIYLLSDCIVFSFYNYNYDCFDIEKITYDGILIDTYEKIDRDQLRVYKDSIYYTVDKSLARKLYKIDGKETIQLANDVDSFLISDDLIYYSENDNVYSMSLSGSSKNLLLRNAKASSLTLVNNRLYYTMLDNDCIAYLDLTDKTVEKFNINRYVCFYTVHENDIYFSDSKTGLYKFDTISKSVELIYEGDIVNPSLIGEGLFFHRNDGFNLNYIYFFNTKDVIKLK